MDMTTPHEMPTDKSRDCSGVSDVLSQIGEKWTMRVVVTLRDQPHRFNEIKRSVVGVSQQMLTRTLKSLERDGMVRRNVRDTTPPQVEYALTALGYSFAEPVRRLAEWASAHRRMIDENRSRYDAKH
jgi:DNA-binding HxlR family transcriptional regulator